MWCHVYADHHAHRLANSIADADGIAHTYVYRNMSDGNANCVANANCITHTNAITDTNP